MKVTLGVPGRIMPPASKALEFCQRAEADGFDAVWWPCHLMGWLPDSVWTEEFTELAKYQANPHMYFDPLTMMGAAGAVTTKLRVGVSVTDTIRRHPAMLAQQALTVDHLAQGRSILGLGSGERMNVAPYGIEWSKPVGRLEEAVRLIRALWEADGPIDFHGNFFNIDGGVMGLDPYEGRTPPIWIAAHGPRMLEITGRLADGWMPTNITPEDYADKLSVIHESAEKAGKDPEDFTPSMLAYVLCAPDEQTLDRLCDEVMIRLLFAAVGLSAETWARHGSSSPFEGGSGFHSYIPATVSREEALRVASHIVPGVVKDATIHGTPEQIADKIRAYQQAGLKDIVLWNITAFGDPSLSGYSFKAMTEVKDLLSAELSAS